ncbi:4043_t:CDS:2 [Rhizophagus irregularis]|nr:4043_t:CDS:2 [Rhizophagus irregularis]
MDTEDIPVPLQSVHNDQTILPLPFPLKTKEINHHLKPVPNWNPGFTNSKSSHANFLYDLWQHRWKNEIFSNRLGIQYNVCFAANSSNFVRKHPGAYIYRKHLMNFKFNPSSNPATKRKQETRFKRHCARVFKNINPTSRTMKEDKLAAGRRFRFLFHESQHIYSPVHHLKFKRSSKEKLLPDPDDYTFNIPYHSLENSSITPTVRSQPLTSYRPSEIATLGDFLPPLGKPAPLYYGHNPVDPTKLNSSYYLQYNPNQPDLPPSIEIRIANRLDLDSSDANGMGTTLKHFYRQALSTRQITVWTKQYHKYMKQPPPPPMPSKKKQKHKWKKWMEKHQDYDDFMSKPYTYKPFTPDKYHTDLFGLVSYTSDETKTVEYHPNKRDITTNPSVLSTSHDNKRPRPANSYLPDSLFTSLNSN